MRKDGETATHLPPSLDWCIIGAMLLEQSQCEMKREERKENQTVPLSDGSDENWIFVVFYTGEGIHASIENDVC